jgi:penicillin-binding protein 1A
MGKGNTGGHIAAPIFGNFMKMALADKPAAPFRVPPGIKLVKVSLKTGLRVTGGETDGIMESFKPGEEPDDAYSVIGFADQSAAAAAAAAGGNDSPDSAYDSPRRAPPPPPMGGAPRGVW